MANEKESGPAAGQGVAGAVGAGAVGAGAVGADAVGADAVVAGAVGAGAVGAGAVGAGAVGADAVGADAVGAGAVGAGAVGADAVGAGAVGADAVGAFDVTLRVRRFNPESDAGAYWEEFTVTAQRTDRVLDALHTVKWEIDGSLTFRRSCAHGICGSDAMRINGRNRLACKALLKDLDPSKPITVEPIKGLPVVKDLVVDMEPFFASYREVMPFLLTGPHTPTSERRQSPEDRARYDDTTKCILCAACTSSCPVFWSDGQYFGPAAIVNAHRFIFDTRDSGAAQRLEILNDKEGVWRCRTIFNCTDACPRGIEVTKAIQEVKRAMITRAF